MQMEVRQRLEAVGVRFEQPLGRGAFAGVWQVRYKGVVRALRVSSYPIGDSPQGRIVERERETLRQIVARLHDLLERYKTQGHSRKE